MTNSVSIQPFDPLVPGLDSDPMTQIQRIFVYFLQNLFKDFPEGSGMRWTPDPNDASPEMIITDEKPEISSIEKVPHLVCVAGSGRWSGLGHDQLQKLTMNTGQRTHTDLMPMNMAYHCQARNGTHARRIAWNASFYTNVFRRLLMGRGKFHHVGVGHDISPESPPSAYTGQLAETEVVSVVVNVPFYWQPAWTIKDPAPVLRSFEMTFKARNTELRPPRIKGKPAHVVTQDDLSKPSRLEQKTVLKDPVE